MSRQKLPIGIQTFSEIRQGGYYYVDKTSLALDMVENGKHYFLSRPRRFGKSLFLDTLKEIFEGNEALFEGLAIHDKWDWTEKYTVLRLSFGSSYYSEAQKLDNTLNQQLTRLEVSLGIEPKSKDVRERFADLIVQAHQKSNKQVVILIDEYDKPILDAISSPELAKANHDFLRSFYSVINDHDPHIKFTFLTGVTKYSNVSLFSGLDKLVDITLTPRYASICGFTERDIDTVFAPELAGLDREQIREWYNGYSWLGESVYNPFEALLLFSRREFKDYWYETGSPDLLIDLISAQKIPTPNLASRNSDDTLLTGFGFENKSIDAIMFQTGYLTIKDSTEIDGNCSYRLGYPNREVYQGLNSSLLHYLVKNSQAQITQQMSLYKLLLVNDFDGLNELFDGFFDSIPHQWYSSNEIQSFEGYYASVFYSYFAALGLDVTVEDCTNVGRIDMTLKFNNQVYIFEFKVIELAPEVNALQQIKDKGYAGKYRALNQPIYMIGVEFSKDSRSVAGFEVEQAKPEPIDFTGFAGMWEDRDISQSDLREKAWK